MVKESSLQCLIFSSLVFRRFGKCGPMMIPAMMNPNTDPKPRCSNRMTHIAVAPRINTKLIRIDDSSTIVASYFKPKAPFKEKILTHLNLWDAM